MREISTAFQQECIGQRITGFLDIFHRPEFWVIEDTAFRKLDLFLSSGEKGRHLLSLAP
jgi:hypothetical protein